jgi:O-antigen/teichoic acid export membrane protein
VRGRPYWRQPVATTIFNFVAVLLLAPRFGAVGTAAASTVCYSALAIFVIWRFCRDTGARASQVLVPTKQDLHVVIRTVRELAGERIRRG